MTELWPCHCGQPGIRNLGTVGYCARHLSDLYATFDPAVFQLNGIGLPGATADDTHLTCTACGATWHGPVGELCHWCERSRQIQLDHQAQLVLTPPDVNPNDITYASRIDAWVDRLVHATRDHIVTAQQAKRALKREVERYGQAA